jgi:hypothetical protein
MTPSAPRHAVPPGSQPRDRVGVRVGPDLGSVAGGELASSSLDAREVGDDREMEAGDVVEHLRREVEHGERVLAAREPDQRCRPELPPGPVEQLERVGDQPPPPPAALPRRRFAWVFAWVGLRLPEPNFFPRWDWPGMLFGIFFLAMGALHDASVGAFFRWNRGRGRGPETRRARDVRRPWGQLSTLTKPYSFCSNTRKPVEKDSSAIQVGGRIFPVRRWYFRGGGTGRVGSRSSLRPMNTGWRHSATEIEDTANFCRRPWPRFEAGFPRIGDGATEATGPPRSLICARDLYPLHLYIQSPLQISVASVAFPF